MSALPNLDTVPTEQLVQALCDRGITDEVLAAIGALHDKLEKDGLLSEAHSHLCYLMYRLRRDAAPLGPAHSVQGQKAYWQRRIDAL